MRLSTLCLVWKNNNTVWKKNKAKTNKKNNNSIQTVARAIILIAEWAIISEPRVAEILFIWPNIIAIKSVVTITTPKVSCIVCTRIGSICKNMIPSDTSLSTSVDTYV